MSNFGGWNAAASSPYSYSPSLPARALEGVRTRRIFALMIDAIMITIVSVGLFFALLILGIVTFGLTWFLIPPLFPVVALIYNGLSISGWPMATPGMRVMDLQMRMIDGSRVPFLNAAAHAIFFYLSWTILTPFILLVSLFSHEKRCLHDMVAGVVVTRRLA